MRTKLPRGVGELKFHYSRMEDFLRNFTGISWNPELGLKVISHVNPSLEASKATRTVKLNQAKQSFRSSPLLFRFTSKRSCIGKNISCYNILLHDWPHHSEGDEITTCTDSLHYICWIFYPHNHQLTCRSCASHRDCWSEKKPAAATTACCSGWPCIMSHEEPIMRWAPHPQCLIS